MFFNFFDELFPIYKTYKNVVDYVSKLSAYWFSILSEGVKSSAMSLRASFSS